MLQIVLGSLQFLMLTFDSTVTPRCSGLPRYQRRRLVPFNEAIWIKHPHLGDQLLGTKTVPPNGTTPTSMKERMASPYGATRGCDATNGLWVVPGSHHLALTYRDFTKAGSDRLADAVPLLCEPRMSRSVTGKSCTEALPTPRQTLGSPSTLASTGDPLFSVLRATVSIVLRHLR